jgi:hypothetical protein
LNTRKLTESGLRTPMKFEPIPNGRRTAVALLRHSRAMVLTIALVVVGFWWALEGAPEVRRRETKSGGPSAAAACP